LRQHFRKKIETATLATPGRPSPAPTGPVITSEQARLQLALMHLSYDAESFANSARQGDALAVSLFLRAGMSPDETPWSYTPFELAVEEGHFDVAKSLIQGGADVDRALPWVAQKGNQELFQLLLSKKPNPEAMAGALYLAAEYAHLDLVQQLVAQGVDVNARGARGVALAGGAYSGRTDVVKYLLGRGAEVNPVDRNTGGMGETPLLSATRSNAENSLEIVALLLKTGASVNAQDQGGTTALMNALDHPDIVSLLLANGADANARTKDQATALIDVVNGPGGIHQRRQPTVVLRVDIGTFVDQHFDKLRVVPPRCKLRSIFISFMTNPTDLADQGCTPRFCSILAIDKSRFFDFIQIRLQNDIKSMDACIPRQNQFLNTRKAYRSFGKVNSESLLIFVRNFFKPPITLVRWFRCVGPIQIILGDVKRAFKRTHQPVQRQCTNPLFALSMQVFCPNPFLATKCHPLLRQLCGLPHTSERCPALRAYSICTVIFFSCPNAPLASNRNVTASFKVVFTVSP